MREIDRGPGTPWAWTRGCATTLCAGHSEHQQGCVLWEGAKGSDPNVFHVTLTGFQPAQRVPTGCRWTQTTLGALALGDLYTTDWEYQVCVLKTTNPSGWPEARSPTGIYLLYMRTPSLLVGSAREIVWKMEWIY